MHSVCVCVCLRMLLRGGSAIKVLSAPSTCEVKTNINTILISWVSRVVKTELTVQEGTLFISVQENK